jgi:hypothetical protein
MEEVSGPKFFTQWSTLSEVGVTDFNYFQIGPREFIAVLTPSNVSVFEVLFSSFFHLHSLPSSKSRGLNTISMDGVQYLVVAGDTSVLYRWNALRQRFEKLQDILSNGAVHVQHFSLGNLDFLIFSCSGTDRLTGETDNTPSYVYAWSSWSNRFRLYQRLPTIGAVRATAESANTDSFLAVAQRNHTSASSSMIFKWNGTYFDFLQASNSSSAYLFGIGECTFAASASTILRYDTSAGRFVFYSTLPTPQNYTMGTEYRHFAINTEHYLTVAVNSNIRKAVLVYRLNGNHFLQYQMLDNVGKAFTSLSGYKSVRGRSILATISSNGVSLWKWSTCVNP